MTPTPYFETTTGPRAKRLLGAIAASCAFHALVGLLIYFDVVTKRSILTRARERLAVGGTLFLGGAETAVGLDEGYIQVPLGRTFGYRRRSP